MPITISGNGDITGLPTGWLPDGIVTPADLSTGAPNWDTSGRLGVGTTNYGGRLTVKTASSNGAPITWSDGFFVVTAGDGTTAPGLGISTNTSDNSISLSALTPGTSWNTIHYRGSSHIFYRSDAASNEAGRWDSTGRLLVGTTSALDPNGIRMAVRGAYPITPIEVQQDTTQTHYAITFRNGNGLVGNITTSASTASFNSVSDYRLKENITAIGDGIARLKQLNPSRFNFIPDPNKTVDGFIAHEVQTVVPEAITGEKDAEDEDGKPIYQGIDQSKLVPLLTAALQEAVARIESLEARIAALEVTP